MKKTFEMIRYIFLPAFLTLLLSAVFFPCVSLSAAAIISPEVSTKLTADVDGDGGNETIYRRKNHIYIIGKDGQSFSTAWPKFIEDGLPPALDDVDRIAVGNFDNDNDLETVIIQNEGYEDNAKNGRINIHILNIDGSYVYGWPITLENCYFVNSIRCGDFNGDGYDEIILIVITRDASGVESKAIYCFGPDGSELFKRPDSSTTEIILADLDGDGSCEIISGDDKGIDAVSKDGASLNGWPFLSYDQIMIPHLAVDIDGDGEIEIIAESNNNKRPVVLSCDGQEKKTNPINKVMLPLHKNRMSYADINGDGLGEVVIERHPRGMASIYKTKTSFDVELAQWAAPHHDKNNTNRWVGPVPKEDIISIEIANISWVVNDIRLGEERRNLDSFGFPEQVLKNVGNIPVYIGVRYYSTASNARILPGTKQDKDRFVTTVNGAVIPERGEAVLSDAIKPGKSLPLCLIYGAPTALSGKASGMNAAYEIRAYKSAGEK